MLVFHFNVTTDVHSGCSRFYLTSQVRKWRRMTMVTYVARKGRTRCTPQVVLVLGAPHPNPTEFDCCLDFCQIWEESLLSKHLGQLLVDFHSKLGNYCQYIYQP